MADQKQNVQSTAGGNFAVAFSYADAAERNAALLPSATSTGKTAIQVDTQDVYRVASVAAPVPPATFGAPVWALVTDPTQAPLTLSPAAGFPGIGTEFLITIALAPAAGLLDTPIYAVGDIPYAFTIFDAQISISTAVGGSTVDVRLEPAGTSLASFSGAATGVDIPTTAGGYFTSDAGSVNVLDNATQSLIVRRSVLGIGVGNLKLRCRRSAE